MFFMADNNGKLHVAMLPWLAFGHLIPFLELAKHLASKGHKISFISTPRNIDRLPKIPPSLTTPSISFIKINLPRVENLPENAEATVDLPFNKVMYLKIAFDGLRRPVADFLNAASPDWIVDDFAAYWLPPLAAELGIRTAYFSVYPAVMLGYIGSPEVLMYGDDERPNLEDLIKPPKWIPSGSNIRITSFQLQRILQNLKDEGDNVRDQYRMGANIRGCDAVVVRSSPDFEPEWLQLLEQLYRKPVIPAGFLPAEAPTISDGEESWTEIKEWLDKQAKGSVVYIAFGSETKPSQYELTQLAKGLEMSELPFYWVLIKQRGSADGEPLELPDGFEERTQGRGIVCTGWAPQLKILSHDSVGGLLIHSGTSSVVEGFQFGRALILLPLLADQELIASYLVEKEVAYMISRDELDGSFSPESVAESLSLVIEKEEGKMYRDKAKELRSLFGDQDKQHKHINNLINFFEDHGPKSLSRTC